MKNIIVSLTVIFVLFIPLSSVLASDIYVVTHNIHSVRAPKTAVETLADCLDNVICKSVLDATATAVGTPPGTIAAISQFSNLAKHSGTGDQESWEWPSPANHAVCRVQFYTKSIAPEGHTRFAISSHVGRAGVFVQTPKQNLFGGRSWFEGYVAITYVKSAKHNENYSAGKCNIASLQYGYSCRSRAEGCNGLVDLGVRYKTADKVN